MPTDVKDASLSQLVKMFEDKQKAVSLLEVDRDKAVEAAAAKAAEPFTADIKAAEDDLKPIQRRLAQLLNVGGTTSAASAPAKAERKRASADDLSKIEEAILNFMQPGEKYPMSTIVDRVSSAVGPKIPVTAVTIRNLLGKLIDDGKIGKEGERSKTTYTRA